jgi:hypothetical protein
VAHKSDVFIPLPPVYFEVNIAKIGENRPKFGKTGGSHVTAPHFKVGARQERSNLA